MCVWFQIISIVMTYFVILMQMQIPNGDGGAGANSTST